MMMMMMSPFPFIFVSHRDYLADKPLPEVNFDRSIFIKTELDRIASGKKMAPFDESRYVLMMGLRYIYRGRNFTRICFCSNTCLGMHVVSPSLSYRVTYKHGGQLSII